MHPEYSRLHCRFKLHRDGASESCLLVLRWVKSKGWESGRIWNEGLAQSQTRLSRCTTFFASLNTLLILSTPTPYPQHHYATCARGFVCSGFYFCFCLPRDMQRGKIVIGGQQQKRFLSSYRSVETIFKMPLVEFFQNFLCQETLLPQWLRLGQGLQGVRWSLEIFTKQRCRDRCASGVFFSYTLLMIKQCNNY